MSDGVFGHLIDEATLRAMPEYRNKERITRADMAKVARDMQDAGGKNKDCATYVENLKKDYGNGVSTRCTVYNATGSDLVYYKAHDWHGRIYTKPYPIIIRNGQWAGWLHVHIDGVPTGSAAAVIYRGVNNCGTVKDWCQSWETPWWPGLSNKVYTEAREKGHYDNMDWCCLHCYLTPESFTDTKDGCVATASIGSGTTTDYVGIMTLTGP